MLAEQGTSLVRFIIGSWVYSQPYTTVSVLSFVWHVLLISMDLKLVTSSTWTRMLEHHERIINKEHHVDVKKRVNVFETYTVIILFNILFCVFITGQNTSLMPVSVRV